jgi:hydrogenase maturation protein HypF
MAVAHLQAAGESPDRARFGEAVDARAWTTVCAMVERRLNCPDTSSVGRLFDGVAALLGVCTHASFDGEAAMRLESLALASTAEGSYPFDLGYDEAVVRVHCGPLVSAIVGEFRAGVPAADVARRFHTSLAALIVDVCGRLREDGAPETVALSGGVFLNRLLSSEATAGLERAGFSVYRNRKVPPNDGGLSFGQLAVAAAADAPRAGSEA